MPNIDYVAKSRSGDGLPKSGVRAGNAQPLQMNYSFSLPRRAEQSGGEETRTVETVVFALIPEFEQVKVRDDAGHIYALTPMTRGVDLLALHDGQRIVCTVTRRLSRVLSAEAIA